MGYFDPVVETLEPPALARLQREKLAALLAAVRADNSFYRRKLDGVAPDAIGDDLRGIEALPLTTRAELEADQRATPPYGENLTYPLADYQRLHQTSGTSGVPLRLLDTAASWRWWKRLWRTIFAAADVTAADRLLYPFSFGPFIGFWSAFEAGGDLSALTLAAGGMSTTARLRYMLDNRATVICCTPTYALRMAEVGAGEGYDLPASSVRALILAGEPGGSVPATRARIESAWGARVFDHIGATEVGAWGFECAEQPGAVHVNEAEFIAEVIDPDSGQRIPDGEAGELTLTNLGRLGAPVIRYRTNDRACLKRGLCACGRWFARVEGGVIGRLDDMLLVRGNNVFPAAIEGILRSVGGVAEFRIRARDEGALGEVEIEIELADGADARSLAGRVDAAIRDELHFRPQVRIVEAGSLPRFEMKARRVVRGDDA